MRNFWTLIYPYVKETKDQLKCLRHPELVSQNDIPASYDKLTRDQGLNTSQEVSCSNFEVL